MEILEKDGTKIAYNVSGDEASQKLILIHGLYVNADCWNYQLPAFETNYHVLRFDLHGHGRSIKPRERFTIRDYVSDMEILLDHLGWEQDLLVVGHSLGGMVALVYALENEQSIDRMVISSSYCFVSDEAMTDVLGRVKSNPLQDFAMGISKRGLSPYDEDDAKWIAKQVTEHLSKKDALLATAASARFNICEHLRELDIPTLLIVGEEDVTTPVWASEMLHDWLPNSELIVVPNAGHMVIIDHYEEFNSQVLTFLS